MVLRRKIKVPNPSPICPSYARVLADFTWPGVVRRACSGPVFHSSLGWICLGAGDTQSGPLGSEASDDEAKRTEEKVTRTDGGDTAQTLVGSLDGSLLWASHCQSRSCRALLAAQPSPGHLFIQQTSPEPSGSMLETVQRAGPTCRPWSFRCGGPRWPAGETVLK